MSTSKLWTPWAVKLHTLTAQSGGAVYLDGVRSVSLAPNLQSILLGGDGTVYNTFSALAAGAPVASVASTDLVTLLDNCGMTGMLIDSDGTHPGVELYEQRMAQGGTRAAYNATTHTQVVIANGLMVPRSLELAHQGVGLITAEIFARQESTTAPLQYDPTADLPNISPADSVAFTLGKVDLNGTQLTGVKSVSIDFGLEVIADAGDGDIYPTFLSIRRVQPTIRVSSVHADFLDTLTVDGAYYASGIVLYARKRTEGGTYVADGTTEHVSFTLGKCRVDPVSIDGDPRTLDLVIQPYQHTTGPVNPITIDTTAAIA